jgi:preprotein translocase subunit SecA
MRIFGSDRMEFFLKKLGLKDDEAIIHPWVNKALEGAQKKVEARNFDMRKNLLKYDDVLNDQRKVIFDQRRELMDAEDVSETITDMRHEVIEELIQKHIPENAYAEQWSVADLKQDLIKFLNLDLPVDVWAKEEGIAEDDILQRVTEASDQSMNERRERFGPEIMAYVERSVLLQSIDHLWREHIVNLDHLRSVVGFRGYAQRDPLQEYKGEAFELFNAMMGNLRENVTAQMTRVELVREPQQPELNAIHENPDQDGNGFADAAEAAEAAALRSGLNYVAPEDRNPEDPSTWGKVNRNEVCPCGSGKKFKHCHGAFE